MNLKEVDLLSREQLKNVLGGSASYYSTPVTSPGYGTCNCNTKDDCSQDAEKPQDCMNSCRGKVGDKFFGKCDGAPSNN